MVLAFRSRRQHGLTRGKQAVGAPDCAKLQPARTPEGLGETRVVSFVHGRKCMAVQTHRSRDAANGRFVAVSGLEPSARRSYPESAGSALIRGQPNRNDTNEQ